MKRQDLVSRFREDNVPPSVVKAILYLHDENKAMYQSLKDLAQIIDQMTGVINEMANAGLALKNATNAISKKMGVNIESEHIEGDK